YVVQPDPARLIALGLGFSDLATAIERNNVSTGAGYVERGGEGLVVRSGGRVTSVAELEGIVVAAREGVPILLRDVGRVTIGQAQRT
ncbi:efflux RND transporter permease subunit, partial [Klebsiella pneumoniae]|nr:efflux RND transporter permease subunit [Klebsiella pneumoniae]